jgi:hypothetical protein
MRWVDDGNYPTVKVLGLIWYYRAPPFGRGLITCKGKQRLVSCCYYDLWTLEEDPSAEISVPCEELWSWFSLSFVSIVD